MSLFDHNELFHQSGPPGMLDYLQSKLEAGDLSSEEALALLSAVHEELGRTKAADPLVYQAYSRFMKSLQKAMPEVYEYVSSTWGHSHRQYGDESVPEVPDESGQQDEGASRESGPETKGGIAEAGIYDRQESREGQEFGEAERPDSQGADAERTKEESIREEAEATGEDEAEEGDEEDEHEEGEEDIEPEEVAQEKEEVEDATSEEPEQEGQEESRGAERGAEESESGEETGRESEAEETEAKSEDVEVEPEIESGGHEGAEWPQPEEPGEEEPIEGEEDGPSPAD